MWAFVLEKQIVTHVTKNVLQVTCFFGIIGTVMLEGLLGRQIMYCILSNFVENLIQLVVTEITKITVSFHCDTRNAFQDTPADQLLG